MSRQRPTFDCWNCRRPFGQTVTLDNDPVLLVECPYCGAGCKVDLNPYREEVVEVIRGGPVETGNQMFRLPEKIPTTESETTE